MLLIGLSFYMMDSLPMLYKLYTGSEITSEKMEKLVSFGSKIFEELKLFSIVLLLSSIAIYFVKTLKQYFLLLLLLLLIHFFFIAEVTEFAVLKRFYKTLVMIPLLWIFFDYFKFKKEDYKNKITHSFLYITLLCVVRPGLYIPPFFGGIQGWTVQLDKSKEFPIQGVFLVREDGKEIRYSRSIVSPINFVNRIDSFMVRTHPEKVEALLDFYEKTYIKRYDILEKGLIPSQKYLGSFAYPTHNPVGNFDYSKFPPNSIKVIKISIKYYKWDKTFTHEEILASKEWR
jgi:hypothetical protein